jgi:hypothetical protein
VEEGGNKRRMNVEVKNQEKKAFLFFKIYMELEEKKMSLIRLYLYICVIHRLYKKGIAFSCCQCATKSANLIWSN